MAKVSKFGLLLLVAACHSNDASTTPKNDAADQGIPKVDPTLCDTQGKNIQTNDHNHENRPDDKQHNKTEDEGGTKVEFMTCKQVDFDHDGRKDWVVAYNRKGTPLYEMADFDYDGKWDMKAVFDAKTGLVAEVERDTDFDGKFDVKEIYDTGGQLTSVRRDRNNDGQPDQWEQYKDGILIAILYDDDFDGKVDRREEIPGAHPKVEMPTTMDPTATGTLGGTGSGAGAPPAPATKPAPAPMK